MKVLRNEEGFAIVVAIMILAILTIIGTAGLNTSITESRISTNSLIHHMEFYAAESGLVVGPLSAWETIKVLDQEDRKVLENISKDYGTPDTLSNLCIYDYKYEPLLDEYGNVVLLGDEDGDSLDELNLAVGYPARLTVTGHGTHPRGGYVETQRIFVFRPAFPLPKAAIRVHSNLNGNGVSGSILGEGEAGSSCDDVVDIMYDVAGGVIDYSGDMGATTRIEESGGIYPISLIDDNLAKRATQTIVGSNNIDESSIITSVDDPGLIYITGDGKTTNLTGHGILFVEGNFEFAGNLNWTGLILVGGDITFSGGGTKTIYGSVVAGGEAVALNGSVDIAYDCEALANLFDKFSGYAPTASWRQL